MEIATSMIQSIKSESCRDLIFLPLYYCALIEECISPKGSKLSCKDKNINENDGCYSACHRFDQSLVNLVVGNFYDFDKTRYTLRGALLKKNKITDEKMISWEHVDDVLKIKKCGKNCKNQ